MLDFCKKLAVVSLLLVLASAGAARTGAPILDPPAVPPSPKSVLAPPHPEAPIPLDPVADVERCAVCKLASRTNEALPHTAFRLEPRVLDNGAVLRLVSEDAHVREALWRATLERGELLAALRAGSDVHLCIECKERRELLAQLEISARRIPEGVVLVYTSSSPSIVQQIHALIRSGAAATSAF